MDVMHGVIRPPFGSKDSATTETSVQLLGGLLWEVQPLRGVRPVGGGRFDTGSRWVKLQIVFGIFHPDLLGEDEAILTKICFKSVGSTTNSCMYLSYKKM